MSKIRIRFIVPQCCHVLGKNREIKENIYPKGITAHEFKDEFCSSNFPLVAVRINNEVCSIMQAIDFDSDVEPIFLNASEGSSVYRRSLCFVLATAADELFPGKRLLVGHSLGYGYYYTLDTGTPIRSEDITALEVRMKEIIAKNSLIEQSLISYKQALHLFESSSQIETHKLLNFVTTSFVTVNSLHNFSDLYFAPLLPSTGLLTVFELLPYGEGFLLRFPQTAHPDCLADFEDIPQLFSVYERYKKWGKSVNVTSVASLNELIVRRKVRDFINITEALQNKMIADVADKIKAREGVRVVLIAGPSSSGKTTTSKKLAMQLQVLGYSPKLIELDSYYVGRELTPKNKQGEYDYECLEALDVDVLNKDLVSLFAGKEIELPSYDFKSGTRKKSGTHMILEENDILILEGIHGLNDKLTPLVSADKKFKVYVSALTQLNLDDHNRVSTSDNRLIRRIVRDSQFRGKTADVTISMWANVQHGERLHIFPFQDNADAMLNTALDYELSVLKVYAEPLLRSVTPLQNEYAETSRLLRFLHNFSPIPVNMVPGQSILREFIGDSEFKY